MMTSFYSGLTGLSAYASALNIVGNNLANINTTAFKSSYINFEDLVASTFGGTSTSASGNPMQIGLGVLPNSVNGIFTQGSIQNSSEATNVALEGNGFFIVGDTVDDRFYTRSGNFSFDRQGYLINPAGKYVLGYTQKDANGEIISSGALDRIFMPSNTVSAPSPTSFIQMFANLNVQDDVGDTYSASITVYDSKGSPHAVTIDFTHNGLVGGNDQWAYSASLPGADVDPPQAAPFVLGAGIMEFDGTGSLIQPAANVNFVTPNFSNGADPLNFNWNIFDEDGVPSFTGYPIPSATNSTNTDGYPPGNLTSLIIDNDGLIQGVFSNGQVEEMGQLATANFNNNKGLLRLGMNLFSETNASGPPSVGAAGTGGRGRVTGSALEASNVDIATEFTNMLIFERGYQANSRIITTSDEIIQESLSLKR
jgi:flagellar hook protein FlgE